MFRFLKSLLVAICAIVAFAPAYADNICRNLLNPEKIHNGTIVGSSGIVNGANNRCYIDYIPVQAGDKVWFSARQNTPPVWNQMWFYSSKNESSFFQSGAGTRFSFGDYSGYMFTAPVTGYFRGLFLQTAPFSPADVADAQILIQSTAPTDYVPYCVPPTKIATTAYNSARFNPVQTELNNTIATIRDIVTNTINQTAAIASLQADKQTRPEDACPAGKKCLLVETEENGVIVPHWFPIIEAPEE